MPAQTEMKGQEWTQITFTKPKSAVKPAEAMKAAQRAGNVLQERKHITRRQRPACRPAHSMRTPRLSSTRPSAPT